MAPSDRTVGASRWLSRVIAVLGSALALGTTITCAWQGLFQRTDCGDERRRYAAAARVQEVGMRVVEFRTREGRLPWRLEEVCTKDGERPRGPEDLLDPWERPLAYSVLAADRFDLRSLGADGAPGGDGSAADISWSEDPREPGPSERR